MFDSVQDILDQTNKYKLKISELTLELEAKKSGKSKESIYQKMLEYFKVMEDSINNSLVSPKKSRSNLVGGEASKIKELIRNNQNICGSIFSKTIMYALAVAETNACMGRIIAAPTAGSCGILPALIYSIKEEKQIDQRTAVMALFNAAAFGSVIAHNASISGAEGGCQAECGSAAAMAAAAAVEMLGGTADMSAQACALVLKSALGLVCDPVAGLVEIPCVKRNANLAAIALSCTEMAMAGIKSVIPADEVISSMKQVGDDLPVALKETSMGGLAVTPTAKKITRDLENIF